MPADIPNPDSEPRWLWATRVTAFAARAAIVGGRTREERFEIYERLITSACEERQRSKSSQHNGSIVEDTGSMPGSNATYSYIDDDDDISISGFEEVEVNT